ncbi:hypothetical protein MJ575_11685 [Klebsiella pneumoniae]|nr:hypothetical protein MJ575_11685 [Klebsiella pneumoniae]
MEVSVRQTTDSHLHILVEDDGPGSRRASAGPFSTAASGLIPASRPNRREIVEQYDGVDHRRESRSVRLHGGGVCRQQMEDKTELIVLHFFTAPASPWRRIRYNPCQTPAVEYQYGLSINA